MSVGRVVKLVVLAGFVSLLTTCTNPAKSDKNISGNSNYVIAGHLNRSLSKKGAAMGTADSIFAIPVISGRIQEDWDKAPAATIATDGTFRIELPKSWDMSSGTKVEDTSTNWMLLLVDSKAATRFDQIVGFLALKELDQSLISFPLMKAKKDSIGMGTVSQNGNEAMGDTSIPSDTAVFNLTIQQLAQMAHTGRTLKMIKNDYGFYNPATKKGLNLRTSYRLGLLTLPQAKNHELLPSEYLDTSKFTFTIQVFPEGTEGFDYSQIAARTTSFDMFPPAGSSMCIENVVGDSTYTAPLNQCYSTDTARNPLIRYDTTGHTSRVNAYVDGSGTSVRCMFFSNFKGISPNGTWELRKDQTTVISKFDLGLGTPIDTLTGKPLIYVPSVNVAVNDADTTITSITVKWFYWNAATGSYARATDPSLIQANISELNIRLNSSAMTTQESQGYGTQPNGTANAQPVPVEAVFTPTAKWKYAPPPPPKGKLSISIDYTCFMQTFEIDITAWSK
jgi:hypothetical protein